MSRSRNIKPGFFENEILGVQDPFVCLLFAGLWTLADKAGILEDRPLRIKAKIFPYRESLDVNGYLTVLKRLGFIHRYEVDGSCYIEVINFKKHQSPHHTERASNFPAYSIGCKVTVRSPLENGGNPPDSLIHRFTDSLIPEKTTDASITPEPTKHTKRQAASAAVRFDAAAFLIEQGADPQTAADYLTLRKSKKAASTVTAMRGLRAQADKAGMTVQAVLEKCCARGWAGFEAKWVDDNARDGPRQTIHDQRKATLDELTGRTRNATQKFDPRDITAEVIRIA